MDILAQITPPPDVNNPYAWFLVLVLGCLGYLGKRYLDGTEDQIKTLREERNQAVVSLAANTASLDRAVGVIESQGKTCIDSVSRNQEELTALKQEVRRLVDIVAGQPPPQKP